MFKLALSFAALSFLFASPATAADKLSDKWIVTQLSGDARVVHPGARPASLSVNNQLAPGDTLLTGPTGRATLVRGGDYIVIAPRSELRLPATPQPTGFTRVIQNLGTLLFKVQHTGIPHFAVDTPMLAAVVKGTTFTVVVDQNRSAVQVIQGAVQVTAITGGMREIVEGGRTVFVNHDNPKLLLDADKPAPTTPTRSSTSVTISAAGDAPLATTIASLTGGLVRAEVTASTTPAATTRPIVQAVVASNSVTPTSTPDDSSSTPAPGAGSATATPTLTTSTPVVTAPSSSTAPVTTPVTTAPAATTPSITVSSVTVAAVTTPTISTGSNSGPSSNSGPGSLNSGSGSSNSGPGSLSSGSGSSNSGPGSTSSGSGSISTSTVTAPTVTTSPVSTPIATVSSVTTPTTTVPSVTAPTVTDLSLSTPTLTVPSISTPTVSTPLVTIPTVTTSTVTVPTITVPLLKL